MNESAKTQVRERANHRCEYCQLKQEDSPLATLHVEHIILIKHGGGEALDNLSLACIDWNLTIQVCSFDLFRVIESVNQLCCRFSSI